MMVVYGGCQSTNDNAKEIEVDSTYHKEEEEMEGDVIMKMIVMVQTHKIPKRSQHPYGSMW